MTVLTADEIVAELRSGMTIGIGGWGARRKPMALVRAMLRSSLTDLEIVSYAGPDLGLLLAAGRVRKVVTGFASLDSIPLEPHFRQARQNATIRLMELDEGMLQLGLQAAAHRLPFLPIRAGLGSDVMRVNPELRTVRSPYPDGGRNWSPCRRSGWTPRWSTSTAPTSTGTRSTWGRTRTSTTCSAWPPTAPSSAASTWCRPLTCSAPARRRAC